MNDLFTDRAVAIIENAGPFARLGLYIFIAFAITRHLALYDAAAITIAFWFVVQALRGGR